MKTMTFIKKYVAALFIACAAISTQAQTVLQNGVPRTGLSASSGTMTIYKITVPEGATYMTITTSGNSYCYLYAKRGAAPTTAEDGYDASSTGFSYTDKEIVIHTSESIRPVSRDWYIGLYGFSNYSGVTLTATYRIPVTYYVSPSGTNGDGKSWTTAKRTIQGAINNISELLPGDVIEVANGTYSPISTDNKYITIRSVNGADVTIIDGEGASRCATMGASETESNTILEGFTLRNGNATDGNGGGGSKGGTLVNCILTGNKTTGYTAYGGGAYGGKLYNCTLVGNTAGGSSRWGGGAALATLNNCILTGNMANDGGGAYRSTLNNCTVTGNTAVNGGGVYAGTLNNCVLTENRAIKGGGSYGGSYSDILNNCTLTKNMASESNGGGSYGGQFNNCIVWGNISNGGFPDDYSGGTFLYSCAPGLPNSNGNIASDPMFTDAANGFFQLQTESPCRNTGSNSYDQGDYDLDDNPRRNGIVDMGAYEYGVGVSIVKVPSAIVTLYVNATRPNDNGDGLSWETAKKTIQAAIDSATDIIAPVRCEILVADGVYAPISTDNTFIAIHSVNGAEATIIDGGSANRCATLTSQPYGASDINPILKGFTLRNGSTSGLYYGQGAGSKGGTLINCILTGNKATGSNDGGGSYGGTLYNCILTGNTVDGANSRGGGASEGTLINCLLTGNLATGLYNRGGGAYNSILNNCTVTGNAATEGGGSYGGTVNNCIVWGNFAADGVTINNHNNNGTFRYTCTTPAPSGGTATITQDPRFADAANGDFRLQFISPCYNEGNNDYAVTGSYDLDGNPRIYGGVVDMGAYEWMPSPVTVTFNPNGGSVSPTQKTAIPGETYSIGFLPTPTAPAGYTFNGWWTAPTGGYQVTASSTVPNSNHTLWARWTAIPYSVTVNRNNTAGGTVTGAGSYTVGQTVRLTAAQNTGYTFTGWTVNAGGVTLSTTTESPTEFVMPANAVTVTANFTANSYMLTVAANPAAGGSPTPASGNRATAAVVSISAGTKTGYTFSGWTSSNGGTFANANSASTTFTMPPNATTITANYTATPYAVTVNRNNSAGGTVAGAGNYTIGQTVTLTATPASGYSFTGWTVNAGGIALSSTTASPTTFTMPANVVTVTANFVSAFNNWLVEQGLVPAGATAAECEAAKVVDFDGDGHNAWEEFVAGTNPKNADDVLRAHIEIVNGKPVITYDAKSGRTYTVVGKANLADAWGEVNDDSRFFAVKVELE